MSLANIIWGYTNWGLKFYEADGVTQYKENGVHVSLVFPLCNIKGMRYEAEEETTLHEFIDNTVEEEVYGDWLMFEMNYEQKVQAAVLKNIGVMKRCRRLGKRMKLIPRLDTSKYTFWVMLSSKNIEYTLDNDGVNSDGHKGLVLKFTTTQLYNVDEVWQSPADKSYQYIDDMYGGGNF